VSCPCEMRILVSKPFRVIRPGSEGWLQWGRSTVAEASQLSSPHKSVAQGAVGDVMCMEPAWTDNFRASSAGFGCMIRGRHPSDRVDEVC